MAKEKNGIGWIKLAVYLAIVLVSVVLAYATLTKESALQAEAIEHQAEDTATLKTDGCDPSGDNTLNVALIQKDISTIQSTQSTIQADVRGLRAEQQAGLKEILERLPK